MANYRESFIGIAYRINYWRWVVIVLLGIAVGVALLIASGGVAYAWMVNLSLGELSAGADSIVTGTVVEQNSYWNEAHINIYTSVTIAVEESLKGAAGQDRITVIIQGGQVGDSAQWVEDTPAFSPGERVAVFLRQLDSTELTDMLAAGQQASTPLYAVFGCYQGKFNVIQDMVGSQTLAQFKEQVNPLLKGEPSTGNSPLQGLGIGTPSISSVTPTSAPAGTGSPNSRVVISGSNFGATQGAGKVYFVRNGYGRPDREAAVLSWSDTSITALVPAGVDGNYLYVNTTAGDSNNFTFDVTFSYDGYKWPGASPVVNYKVNATSSSPPTGAATAVQAAAATWNAATGTNFTLNYAGPTDQTTPGYPEFRIWWQNDGANLIPALSSVSYSGGFITEAHIKFNSFYTWSTDTPPSHYDIESIALHEFGHWLSLHDQNNTFNDSAKVMYGTLGYAQKRALASTDRAGIQWIYGSAPDPPGAPPLSSPAPGANVPGTSVTFSWTAPSGTGIDNYWLRVNTNSSFTGTDIYNGAVGYVGSKTVSGFPNTGGTYYWYVLAHNAAGWGPASSARSFVNGATLSLPGAPPLSSPLDGAHVPGTQVTFSWTAPTGTGIDGYYLRVNTNSSFTGTDIYSGGVGYVGSKTVSGFPNTSATYYWYVLAHNAAGWGTVSSVRSFINGP